MDATAKSLPIRQGILAFTTQARSQWKPSQGDASSKGLVKVDGSSTVYPISEAIAKEFQKTQTGNVQVQVSFEGTGS